MSKDSDYRKLIRQWIAGEREKKAREQADTVVKYSKLKAKMPLGCWLWIGVGVVAVFLILRWIYQHFAI